MSEICIYQGYFCWDFPWKGEKHYRARVFVGMELRHSRKKFKKASQAMIYGYKLADRYNRMVSCAG